MMLLFFACSAADDSDTSASSVDPGPVTVAAADVDTPSDAGPSADGSTFYFLDADGLASVPADGSAEPTRMDTFSGGVGLAIAPDDAHVYVSAAASADSESLSLYVVHLDGSATDEMPEAVGLSPGGLAAIATTQISSHRDALYFTGRTASFAASGAGAVYLFPVDGLPTLLATGFDGGLPAALTAAADHTLYVSVVDADGGGSVWRIPADVVDLDGAADPTTAATRVVDGWRPGEVPGIALTFDESTLLVSSLSDAGTSQVVLVDLASGGTSIFDDVIRENTHSGGVHRARDTNVFAWADIQKPGHVYRVDP